MKLFSVFLNSSRIYYSKPNNLSSRLPFQSRNMCSEPVRPPLLLHLLNEVVHEVGIASGIVRNVLQHGNLGVVDKGIDDLQTKADRAAQQYIVSKLSSKFPKASIIGEEPEDSVTESLDGLITTDQVQEFPEISNYTLPESLKAINEEDIVIWIDPLDGTAEFTQGLVEHVTILVGIAANGKPIAGVIHQPFSKPPRTVYGIPGVGLGGMTFNKPPAGTRTITVTRSHNSPKLEKALETLNPTDVLRVGGAGHKIMLVLEGKAHAYVYPSAGCKKWDTCAPEAVLRAAGGILTDMFGQAYNYSKDVKHMNETGVIATAPGEDHDWYVNQINKTS